MLKSLKIKRYRRLVYLVLKVFTTFKKQDAEFIYNRINDAEREYPEDANGTNKFTYVFQKIKNRYPGAGHTSIMIAMHLILSYVKKQIALEEDV